MIKKLINIKNHQDFITTGNTWGLVFGLTDNGGVEYYTGQTNSNAYVAKIPVLLNNTIDDIGYYTPILDIWLVNTRYNTGNIVLYNDNTYICTHEHTSGVFFNDSHWDIRPINNLNETVMYIGESKINEFRRYGKQDNEPDLYNPTWNTGFTQTIDTSDGMVKQITNERDKLSGLDSQKLYDYKIWVSGNTGTTINYSDIGGGLSEISYKTNGLSNINSIETPKVKLDYLIGVINEPKIKIDVFIDRGNNSSFDRHIRLGDVKSLVDLENYGNKYFKIKED